MHIDLRKRAFLIYLPVADGSRVLTIGCLRDVDNFTVMSSGLHIGANNETKATFAVSIGTARYAVDGEVEPDQATGMQAFNTDIDADAKVLRQISGTLLPVLEGKGAHRSHGRIRRVHAADGRFDATFVTFQHDMLWIPLKAAQSHCTMTGQ